jgi:hypothetical protein
MLHPASFGMARRHEQGGPADHDAFAPHIGPAIRLSVEPVNVAR